MHRNTREVRDHRTATNHHFRECIMNTPPRRRKNSELRPREYLTSDEVQRLINAARSSGRHGHRDATMLLMAFRHGLRVSELVSLRWDQINFKESQVYVSRLKNGRQGNHPLWGPELRALRRIQRENGSGSYIFLTERKGPITPSTVRKIVKRAGQKAGIEFPTHPHQLRHSCGFMLANKGVDLRTIQQFLGHQNIQNTVVYTELSAQRFKDFWQD